MGRKQPSDWNACTIHFYKQKETNMIIAKLNQPEFEYDIHSLVKAFYPEETVSWIKKLLMSAYIKYSIGKDDEAELIYGLTEDKLLITELLNNILKRSIYEYLTKIKYDKNANAYNFTNEEIDDKISYIEENWVQHV